MFSFKFAACPTAQLLKQWGTNIGHPMTDTVQVILNTSHKVSHTWEKVTEIPNQEANRRLHVEDKLSPGECCLIPSLFLLFR